MSDAKPVAAPSGSKKLIIIVVVAVLVSVGAANNPSDMLSKLSRSTACTMASVAAVHLLPVMLEERSTRMTIAAGACFAT